MTTPKSKSKELQFAAFARVSTEKQEKTGESLRTQRKEIKEAVDILGGKIVGWYGGQEHATPGYEKKEIDRLLKDAKRKPKIFNAVMFSDADRWSRDNQKSKQGLDIFEHCGIRFFIGIAEQDLTNEDNLLFLGISAVIGQYFAQKGKRKSLTNRINRAKRGLPACGNLPYARTFDKKMETWGVDENKKPKIEDAAGRYIAGEKLPDIADEYSMDASYLYKILTKRSGDEWVQTFNSDKLNLHETIKTKIPRLLSEKTIELIREKSQANKTYTHGKIKNHYLLGRMIFCKSCGYAMPGQTSHDLGGNPWRYYRHMRKKTPNGKLKCKHHSIGVDANKIEELVMLYLFDCFGNPAAVQKAIEKAIPNLEKIKESQKRIDRIDVELNKIKKGRAAILRFITNEKITESQAEKQLEELNQRESRLQVEHERLCSSLQNNPNPDKIKSMSKKVSTKFKRSVRLGSIRFRASAKPYSEMTYEEKRALVELVFGGKMPNGKRMGVYLKMNSRKDWSFDIHGHLIDEEGLMPLSDNMKETCFGDSDSGGYKQKQLLTKYPMYLLRQKR